MSLSLFEVVKEPLWGAQRGLMRSSERHYQSVIWPIWENRCFMQSEWIFMQLFDGRIKSKNEGLRTWHFCVYIIDINLKSASPKAANIHNRWWRERSEWNLRFHSKITKRPRRGRTQASCANIPYVRPRRGRCYHHSLDRRLRCLRQLNQRLWIFAAFGDAFLLWQATKSSAATLSWDNNLSGMCLSCACDSLMTNKKRDAPKGASPC